MQRLHEGDVQRLQPVARRRNEVEAAVDAIVANVASVETRFVLQVFLELVVDVGNDRFETAVIIDGIAVTRRVHHG